MAVFVILPTVQMDDRQFGQSDRLTSDTDLSNLYSVV